MQAYVQVCLDSLLVQTFKDIEIIVIDDGSSDITVKIVQEYARVDRRISLKTLPKNVGTFLARVEGLKLVQGKYFCMVDADDWVSPHFVRRLYETAEHRSADIVECSLRAVNSNGRSTYLSCAEQSPNTATGSTIVSKVLERKIWHIAANKIFRRELVEQSMSFICSITDKLVVADDKLFTFPLYYFAKKFIRIPDLLYFYRHRTDSATNNRVLEHDIIHIRHTHLVDSAIKRFLAEQQASPEVLALAGRNREDEVHIALRNIYQYPANDHRREILSDELLMCFGPPAFTSLVKAYEHSSALTNAELEKLGKERLVRVILTSLLRALKSIRVLLFPPSK